MIFDGTKSAVGKHDAKDPRCDAYRALLPPIKLAVGFWVQCVSLQHKGAELTSLKQFQIKGFTQERVPAILLYNFIVILLYIKESSVLYTK